MLDDLINDGNVSILSWLIDESVSVKDKAVWDFFLCCSIKMKQDLLPVLAKIEVSGDLSNDHHHTYIFAGVPSFLDVVASLNPELSSFTF